MKLFFDQFISVETEQRAPLVRLHGGLPSYQSWEALRSVTLSLDISHIVERDEEGQLRLVDESTALDADRAYHGNPTTQWRLLLERPFDKITLLVTDASNGEGKLTDNEIGNYELAVETLREYLIFMGDNIGEEWDEFQTCLDMEELPKVVPQEHSPGYRYYDKSYECPCCGWYEDDTYNPPDRKDFATEKLYRFARVQYERLRDKDYRTRVEAYACVRGNASLTTRRIQTKTICFAWNFLPPNSKMPTKLQGQKFRYTEKRVARLCEQNDMGTPKRWQYDEAWPHRYEVSANKTLIGEMGISHPNRWTMASDEYDRYSGMMCELIDTANVESKGIGMEVREVREYTDDEASDGNN